MGESASKAQHSTMQQANASPVATGNASAAAKWEASQAPSEGGCRSAAATHLSALLPSPGLSLQYLAASSSTRLSLCCASSCMRCSRAATFSGSPTAGCCAPLPCPAASAAASVVGRAASAPAELASARPWMLLLLLLAAAESLAAPAAGPHRELAPLLPAARGWALGATRTSPNCPSSAAGAGVDRCPDVEANDGKPGMAPVAGAGGWRQAVGWRQAAAAHPSAAWRWPSCGRAAVAPTPCRLPWSSGPAPSSGNPPAGRPPAPPAAPGNPAQLGWLQINQIMLHIEMAACRERRLACKAHLRRVQRLLKRADRHFDAINDCRAGDRAAWSRKLACMAQCAEWLL